MTPAIKTVKAKIAWSYANLARAHAALTDGSPAYLQKHHMIRSRLFSGIMHERLFIRSLLHDEKVKMMADRSCSYCGSTGALSVDHLIPKMAGGKDIGDNLILACRPCNSSKQGRDLLVWMNNSGTFPSIMVLRRYTKLVVQHCEAVGLLDTEMDAIDAHDLPFSVHLLPTNFPPLSQLRII